MTVVLLAGASLFLQSLWRAGRADLGVDRDHVLIGSFDLFQGGYDEAHGRVFLRRLVDDSRRLPGVVSASVAMRLPFSVRGPVTAPIEVPGLSHGPDDRPFAEYNIVGPDYARTIGVSILRGRDLTEDDQEQSPPVAIVNETMARRYWPGRNAIGVTSADPGRVGDRQGGRGRCILPPSVRMSSGPRPPLAAPPEFDSAAARRDFPALWQPVHGRPLVYLDNAATTQKPAFVIDRLARYYREENANVHRGVHALSDRATEAYERARQVVARFLNACDRREIVFVRGATEAINLVACSYGRSQLGPKDEVVVSAMEHHSNIVPWQAVCAERGARLRVVPISDAGEIDLDALANLLSERTRIVSIAHVSNALGTVNPIAEIVRLAHRVGSAVLVDGAQAAAHMPVDVQDLGCDFYACSGHKMFGPTGIGVLYGRLPLLEAMPPYQHGGDMITSVRFEGTEYQPPPHRFEAGTPHIAGVVGLAAAVDYVSALGLDRIAEHERALAARATEALARVPGVRIVGRPATRAGIVSFVMDGVHPHDIGTVLDREGVAIRAGHHCCQPLMDRLGLPATARASFACYNTLADVEALTAALHTAREVFG